MCYTAYDYPSSIAKTHAKVERLRNDPSKHKVRVLRTERHAHLIKISRDRKIAESLIPDVDDFTYNDLVQFAEDSVCLVDEIKYLWDQTVIGCRDRVGRVEGWSTDYWNAVPRLADHDVAR